MISFFFFTNSEEKEKKGKRGQLEYIRRMVKSFFLLAVGRGYLSRVPIKRFIAAVGFKIVSLFIALRHFFYYLHHTDTDTDTEWYRNRTQKVE